MTTGDSHVVAEQSATAIAVDIGASTVRAARVDRSGVCGAIVRRSLEADFPTATIVGVVRDAIREVGWTAPDRGVGIGIPGFLDEAGRVQFAGNLQGLNGLSLADALAGTLPRDRVFVVPDVAAAALGEAVAGAGRGVERFLCAAIGTGVNAAMTVHGRILETVAGCLGDAGHVLVEPAGPRCPCGGLGCLEAVTSGIALARDGAPYGFDDAAAVVQAAREGHAQASAIVERAGTALGRAIATWCTMLWPDRIAIGGGVGTAGDLLLAPARRELARVGVPYLTQVDVVEAQLGGDAGLVGCGLFALSRSSTPQG
jgi:glucokinase